AVKHIKTRVGAQLATIVLGILIFVDDYFNCLTVGSVMRPVTDTHKVSRSKLSYLIDATAAPVCIIAPISSWAAAVTSSVPDDAGINGFVTFLRTIPYNFYALLTILMMVVLVVRRIDYGPMRKHELNAIAGDLFTTGQEKFTDDDAVNQNGRVADLIIPVLVLIAACIMGMVYTGGFFSGEGFVTAFANADASVGLVIGGIIAVIFAFFYYLLRGVLTFKEFTACIPEGFKAMLAPILILTLAWTLSGMTGLLGAKYFVANLVAGSAAAVQILLPAIIFLVALGLAFATGTSWGTFGILIPIVLGVFPEGEMMVISIAACLAGAVCGDHCSPISDTTIMASAGGQCNHINHVSTQLPYALTCAAVCFVAYIFAGLTKNPAVSLVIGAALMIVVLLVIEKKTGREKVA
ncbi:MAG: Na+/H+ antiporter NhaC family protein, partial [Lachnospiraceae bacterium]|nr:Na+/H+ antiporter NhaC family protein [Lachnospiraceae bacterium]